LGERAMCLLRNVLLISQLSSLPRDDLPYLNRKYCPRCYPNVLGKHLELYF